MAVVLGGHAGGLLHRPHLLQPVLVAEAVVGGALLHQFLGVALEHPHPLALDIRPHRAADIRALVPDQPGLPQGVVDDIHRPLHVPLLVGVLDAQQEGASLVLGGEVGVKSGAQVAHVHVAGGAGGEACPDLVKFHLFLTTFFCLNRLGTGLVFLLLLYYRYPAPKSSGAIAPL